MDPFHRGPYTITLSPAKLCDNRASQAPRPFYTNKDLLMSKPPRYAGLLLALVFTALAKLPASGAEQQPATPSEATPAEAATPSTTPAAASSIPVEQTERRPIIERYQ